MTQADSTHDDQPQSDRTSPATGDSHDAAAPVKYVRRDDLLAEAGMQPRNDYVLALAALSMLIGMLLMTCSPLSMAWMLRSDTNLLGEGGVTRIALAIIAILFVLGLWALVAGTLVGYRIEVGRKALLAWSVTWIGYVIGTAILRVTWGGTEQRDMRLSELACFLGFSVGLLGLLVVVPIANLRHLTKKQVKATFRTLAEARRP